MCRHPSSSRAFHWVVFSSSVCVAGQSRLFFPSRILPHKPHTLQTTRRVLLGRLRSHWLVRNCGANVVAVTFLVSAPQMLCPERCECLASHLASLLSVFLVSLSFSMVKLVSLARSTFMLQLVFAYSMSWQIMIFVN
jgi:hypothetical protein